MADEKDLESGNPGEPSTPEPEQGKEVQKKEEEKPPKEPLVPLSRLREEASKRKELEKALEEKKGLEKNNNDIPQSQQEAERYLRNLVNDVIDKKTAEQVAKQKAEDDAYNELLDEFSKLDPDFDKKKFSQLVVKYKPSDEESAWALWNTFKKNIKNTSEKPKMPSGIKTTDDTQNTIKYKDDKDKSLWEIVEDAKKGIS